MEPEPTKTTQMNPKLRAKWRIMQSQQTQDKVKKPYARKTSSARDKLSPQSQAQDLAKPKKNKAKIDMSRRESKPNSFNGATAKPVKANARPNQDQRPMKVEAKSCGNQGSQRKAMVVDASQLPPPIGYNYQRRSSFTKRKAIDNSLGYNGRKRHRHSWQEEREKDYFNYMYHTQRDYSDSD